MIDARVLLGPADDPDEERCPASRCRCGPSWAVARSSGSSSATCPHPPLGSRRPGPPRAVRQIESPSRSATPSSSPGSKPRTAAPELDEAKDDFLRGVSHNLQTPLTSIRATPSSCAESDRPDRRLGIIVEQADRLSRMVRQLLTVTRLESGALQAAARSSRWRARVRSAWEALARRTCFVHVDDRCGGLAGRCRPTSSTRSCGPCSTTPSSTGAARRSRSRVGRIPGPAASVSRSPTAGLGRPGRGPRAAVRRFESRGRSTAVPTRAAAWASTCPASCAGPWAATSGSSRAVPGRGAAFTLTICRRTRRLSRALTRRTAWSPVCGAQRQLTTAGTVRALPRMGPSAGRGAQRPHCKVACKSMRTLRPWRRLSVSSNRRGPIDAVSTGSGPRVAADGAPRCFPQAASGTCVPSVAETPWAGARRVRPDRPGPCYPALIAVRLRTAVLHLHRDVNAAREGAYYAADPRPDSLSVRALQPGVMTPRP